MNVTIGIGGIVLFLLLTIFVMEKSKKPSDNLSDFATAGRSFGPFFGSMAYINSFLAGTVFISFAGLAASSGIIGYYLTAYTCLGVLIMLALAKPVFRWGKKFDLKTQADLLALRYRSQAVRLVAGILGIVATVPWIVLGFQSLALVFEFISGRAIAPIVAIVLSVVVIGVRQIWTVRHGMRGIIISDMVQGIFAYFIGTLVAIGLIVTLVTGGHGFADVPDGFTSLRGPGDAFGPLYALGITLTGALGTWCWPEMFVRLFTQRSTVTLQRTALIALPIMLVFTTALITVAYLASTYPGVSDAPDHVWFILASDQGIWVLLLLCLAVLGASLGNVGANVQAVGTQVTNDIVGVVKPEAKHGARVAKWMVGLTVVLSAALALAALNMVSGLVSLAMLSYEGIVQLAPTLLLGVFWRRATAAAAVSGMITGFTLAVALQFIYPLSIPWLGGLTPGIAAMVINTLVIVAVSLVRPHTPVEKERVDELWALTGAAGDSLETSVPVVAPERT